MFPTLLEAPSRHTRREQRRAWDALFSEPEWAAPPEVVDSDIRVFARIVGKTEPAGSGSGAGMVAYHWAGQVELPDGEHEDDPRLAGDADYYPAYELSNNADVPVDGTVLVELFPGRGGPYFRFSYPNPGAALGVGSGSGTTTTCVNFLYDWWCEEGSGSGTGNRVPVKDRRSITFPFPVFVSESLCGTDGLPDDEIPDECHSLIGTTPETVSVTFAGVTDGTTSGCDAINGTWELPYVGDCTWRLNDAFPLLGTQDGDISLVDITTGWRLTVSAVGSPLATYDYYGTWNGTDPLVLNLVGNDQSCATWPATVTVTPL